MLEEVDDLRIGVRVGIADTRGEVLIEFLNCDTDKFPKNFNAKKFVSMSQQVNSFQLDCCIMISTSRKGAGRTLPIHRTV